MSVTAEVLRLREWLARQDVSESAITAASVWEAFKSYGREVFHVDGIGLLFQVGVFHFSGPRQFYFDPVVQFARLDEDGEHDHFEQLHCELTCAPTEALERTKAVLWSFDFSTADAFFAAVESLPEFRTAIQANGYALQVMHEIV
ncbi:hypothetical protein [Dyella jiangningensis]|uniref:hypothetical protein n=1 Tax=Dyella jiangningensis TaxID=1379159 RepID=UPI0011BE401A|nr:hypothetical protein [Dyella jiangningensis]